MGRAKPGEEAGVFGGLIDIPLTLSAQLAPVTCGSSLGGLLGEQRTSHETLTGLIINPLLTLLLHSQILLVFLFVCFFDFKTFY